MLFSFSFFQAQVPACGSRPGHMTRATATSCLKRTLNFGKQATEPSNIYGCRCMVNPQGKTVI